MADDAGSTGETGDRQMPDRETVEGWSNYPTWAVNLWLANDRKLGEEARRRVRGVTTIERRSEWESAHVGDVARMLKAWIEDREPRRVPAPFDSLMAYGLAEVDWYELAEEWISNAAEDPTAELERADGAAVTRRADGVLLSKRSDGAEVEL